MSRAMTSTIKHKSSAQATPTTNANQHTASISLESLFWFGNEDKEHLRFVFIDYERWLGIGSQRSMYSRAPVEFIGKIFRSVHYGIDGSDTMCTFDEISVYQRDFVPIDHAMTQLRTVKALTEWNIEDGTPSSHRRLNRRDLQRLVPSSAPVAVCYAQCRPVYGDNSAFEFSSLSDIHNSSQRIIESTLQPICYANAECQLLLSSMRQLARAHTPMYTVEERIFDDDDDDDDDGNMLNLDDDDFLDDEDDDRDLEAELLSMQESLQQSQSFGLMGDGLDDEFFAEQLM